MQQERHDPSASGTLLEATATVIGLDRNMAIVETGRSDACSGCGAAAGCGTSVLGGVLGRRQNRLAIRNTFEAVPGEQVIIGLPEKDLVMASLVAYMLPLVAMILLAVVLRALGFGDVTAGIVSLVGLAAGLALAGHITRKSTRRFVPRFVRRVSETFPARVCGP